MPLSYPRVPGHEVAGVVDALGPGVSSWAVGQRVGVGWNGGFCGVCAACRRGDLFACVTRQVTGLTYDGGYADYMIAPASAVAAVPPELMPVEVAPLMCAGITTFNSPRNCRARDQEISWPSWAWAASGTSVSSSPRRWASAPSRSRAAPRRPSSRPSWAPGATSTARRAIPAAELGKLGGAKVVLATVTDGAAMAATLGGIAVNGTLMVLGGVQTMTISPLLMFGRQSVRGWYSGTAIDSEDTMAFSAMTGVSSMNEVFPLEKAAEAYDRMMSGGARFRVVLSISR